MNLKIQDSRIPGISKNTVTDIWDINNIHIYCGGTGIPPILKTKQFSHANITNKAVSLR